MLVHEAADGLPSIGLNLYNPLVSKLSDRCSAQKAALRWILGISGVFFLALRVFVLQKRYYDTDELEHLHAAWSVAQGQVLYKDFFEHHGPLLPLSLSA